MKTFGKILLVLIITIIGAGVTCGGTGVIGIITGIKLTSYWGLNNLGILIWFIQIIAIFIFSIWFLFFRKKNTIISKDTDKKIPPNNP